MMQRYIYNSGSMHEVSEDKFNWLKSQGLIEETPASDEYEKGQVWYFPPSLPILAASAMGHPRLLSALIYTLLNLDEPGAPDT